LLYYQRRSKRPAFEDRTDTRQARQEKLFAALDVLEGAIRRFVLAVFSLYSPTPGAAVAVEGEAPRGGRCRGRRVESPKDARRIC
jgi:hypothetical protein